MATLTWERRDGQRMVFHLQGLETTIGRDLGNPIRIESGYVSKRHAVIRLGQQGYTIADLNSSNGTFINGQRTALAVLKDGDRIELGSEALTFSNPVAGTQPGAPAAEKKSPMKFVIIGGGAAMVLLLGVLILGGGSSAPPESSQRPAAAPAAESPGPSDVPAYPPVGTDAGTAPPAAAPLPSYPDTAGVPAGAQPLPSNDPAALYEIAISHVKGKRYVEARTLLQAAVRLDPGNTSAQQRLREVEATIQVLADQHMAAGQRAFTYLRYDDAIFEWEQVTSMIEATDPRYQQAAAGIRRAQERLVQKD
ncbi:MAG: FHA domain-containing protein [Acidobacteria bacterium]|nr:FHA domain-containing protein [Acidobacteriota bacterium]